jgi:hypothetical protein
MSSPKSEIVGFSARNKICPRCFSMTRKRTLGEALMSADVGGYKKQNPQKTCKKTHLADHSTCSHNRSNNPMFGHRCMD